VLQGNLNAENTIFSADHTKTSRHTLQPGTKKNPEAKIWVSKASEERCSCIGGRTLHTRNPDGHLLPLMGGCFPEAPWKRIKVVVRGGTLPVALRGRKGEDGERRQVENVAGNNWRCVQIKREGVRKKTAPPQELVRRDP